VGVRAGSLRFVLDLSRPVDLPLRSANVLNHKHISLGFQLLEPFTRAAAANLPAAFRQEHEVNTRRIFATPGWKERLSARGFEAADVEADVKPK
jgi:hypothetical protein